jgi:hypothetical protein
MKTKFIFFTSLFFLVTFFSCHKNKDSVEPSSETKIKAVGIVKNESGEPISGVTIKIGNKQTTTGSIGQFVISDLLSDSRCVLKCKSASHYDLTTAEQVRNGIANFNITLIEKTIIGTLSASAGGTVSPSAGGVLTLPANGFINAAGLAYNGDVSIAARYLDPSETDFAFLLPSQDMMATNEAGTVGALYSYGMMMIELMDASGNELNLAPGSEATITLPVSTGQQGSAPAIIPLWYYDEEKGIWIEEGEATKIGNNYVGNVKHFTYWNCDFFSPDQATVKGKVVDCHGNAVSYASVRTGQSWVTTDANGMYERRVPSEVEFVIQVVPSWGFEIGSNTVLVSALIAGQVYLVPDLVLVSCPTTIKGQIKDCNSNSMASWIKASKASGWTQYVFSETGDFEIAVPNQNDVELTIYKSNSVQNLTVNVTGLLAGELKDIGTVELCLPAVLEINSALIDGILNPFVSVNTQTTNEGDMYYGITASGDSIVILLAANTVPASSVLTIEPNSSVLTSDNCHIRFSSGGTTYLANSGSITLNVSASNYTIDFTFNTISFLSSSESKIISSNLIQDLYPQSGQAIWLTSFEPNTDSSDVLWTGMYYYHFDVDSVSNVCQSNTNGAPAAHSGNYMYHLRTNIPSTSYYSGGFGWKPGTGNTFDTLDFNDEFEFYINYNLNITTALTIQLTDLDGEIYDYSIPAAASSYSTWKRYTISFNSFLWDQYLNTSGGDKTLTITDIEQIHIFMSNAGVQGTSQEIYLDDLKIIDRPGGEKTKTNIASN